MGIDFDFSALDAQDVLDLAIYIEREAQENYEQIASWLEGDGRDELAELFTELATQEARHGDKIARVRKSLFGDDPPKITGNVAWEAEVPDYDKIGDSLTLEGVLKIALEAETRAHDYYAEAQEYVADKKALDLLEGLRRAEIEHQRMIQTRLDGLKK